MTSDESATQPVIGQAIADCLDIILKNCKEVAERLNYPGEGGERPFRGWLVSDLLIGLFGWPSEKVIVGERFDILLLDSEGFPVVTIETKSPYHKASKKERDDFEKRLMGYGTLRTAYFTNGVEWEKLDIFAPTGALTIRDRSKLNLHAADSDMIEAFFKPLFADRHFQYAPRSTRHAICRDNPHILEALAADLNQIIGDLTLYFCSFFNGLREGKSGKQSNIITEALFNLWCEKSLISPPSTAAEQLVGYLKKGDLTSRDIINIFTDLGLKNPKIHDVAEELSCLQTPKKQDVKAVNELIWPAYDQAVYNLCAQTAHVILGRALLYRVGEDQNIFPRILSGEHLEQEVESPIPRVIEKQFPAIDLLIKVRLSMQSFLPIVYKLSEFDWWLVAEDKRATLNDTEHEWLQQKDIEFERISQHFLRLLNGYFFGRVDVDVWRNIYQQYLPSEERQRIGGFYTPDELVQLILDLSGYTSNKEDLCELSFIDPACGSGAFVTEALGRLIVHLQTPLFCHEHLFKRGMPEWKHAEQVLNIISERLHAVDLHPFAAFLTTLNVLFSVLPLYVKTRIKNPNFSLNLQVFTADSLEKPHKQLLKPDIFARLNSRVQLTEESHRRYQEIQEKKFDLVFGNPPWGGVLKGPLAPVYDTLKKRRFSLEFPAAARGKYDIYALFMERALQILRPGGRFGLLTQGTFIDKKWAQGLRTVLANDTSLRYIIDLNPFGQLFFGAMNTPCVTIANNGQEPEGDCTAILSIPLREPSDLDKNERRKRVVAIVRRALDKIARGQNKATVNFARAALIPRKQLLETARERWNLGGSTPKIDFPKSWSRVVDLLEPFQGVTVGGKGCLEIMLMTMEKAKSKELEPELIHSVIKGLEITRWVTSGLDKVILYPYDFSSQAVQPAFKIDHSKVKNSHIRETLRRLGVNDGLEFDRQLDDREKDIAGRRGINRYTVSDLLRHRLALGLIKYPKAAVYLVQHYEQLEGRVFKKKNVREFNRRWYEYIWPRDPKVMLTTPKILTPRLTREVRFALDNNGIVPQDSCICLTPTLRTNKAWNRLCNQLSEVLGQQITEEDPLKYCLAFLNSPYAQKQLITGHLPTPKGSYAVTDDYLIEIPIPPPRDRKTTASLLSFVDKLLVATDKQETVRLETDLGKIVERMIKVRGR